MIYTKAQGDTVCGLLHQHNLNATLAAVKHIPKAVLENEES